MILKYHISIPIAILNMVVVKNEITYHIKYIIIIANFLGNKLLEFTLQTISPPSTDRPLKEA
jgi:hypothetical protein